ncbi:hypothetical protein DICA1_C05798 [Diutina catenulata]
MEFSVNISAERSVVRESVKGILWTIFFHRLFGPITAIDGEFLGVVYPMADLPQLDIEIDEKVDAVVRRLDSHSQRGVIVVAFQQKQKKRGGWFKAEADELITWEKWRIDILNKPHDPKVGTAGAVANFEENMLKVISTFDAHKDHIPPITNLDSSPFPYTITVE